MHQLEDDRTLQALGFKYGDVMNGRELYKLLFERVHPSKILNWTSKPGSFWHISWTDPAKGFSDYDKGREMLMKEFAIAAGGGKPAKS